MIYRFGNFSLDDEAFELMRGDQKVPVERRVLDLILHLVRNRDRVVSRAELCHLLWPDVVVNSEHGLNQAVYTARKVLRCADGPCRSILTVRGRGFRFVDEVSEFLASPSCGLRGEMPFVGRDAELARLSEVLQELGCRRGSIGLVFGEAGIGKTRLSDEVNQLAGELNVTAISAQCVADGSGPDYWPFVQLLRQMTDADRLSVSQDDPALRPVTRWLVTAEDPVKVAEGDPGLARFRLFDWMQQCIAGMGADRPVLIVIDDLQFADRSSLAFLRYLAPQIKDYPVGILCLLRHPAPGQVRCPAELNAALSTIRGLSSSYELHLSGLDTSSVRSLLSAWVDARFLEAATVAVVEKTSGNPFFVRQLIPYIDRIKGHLDDVLPPSLCDVIRVRLAGLPSSVWMLLEAASVLLPPVSPASIERLCELHAECLAEAKAAAQTAGVLKENVDKTIDFSHGLIRDVIYQGIPASRRAKLHQAAAKLFSDNGTPDTAALRARVHHLLRALPLGSLGDALVALQRAADAAIAVGAYDEASSYLESCLSLCDCSSDRKRFRLTLGDCLIRAGAREKGRAEIRRALDESTSDSDLAEAALRIAPGFFAIEAGTQDVLIEDLLRSAAEASDLDSELRALLKARLAMALYWNPAEDQSRISLAQEALKLTGGCTRATARSSWIESYTLAAQWAPRTLDERLATATKLAGATVADQECRLMAYVFLITSLVEAGRMDEAFFQLHRFERFATAAHVRQALWYVPLMHGMFAVERGRLAEADHLAEKTLEQGLSAGDGNATQASGALRALCSFHRGPSQDLARAIEGMVDRFPSLGAWESALALVLERSGDRVAAMELYQRQLRSVDAWRQDLIWLVAVVQLAELCADLSDARTARRLLALLKRYCGRRVPVAYAVGTWGSVDRVVGRLLGCVGEYSKAEGLLLEAIGSDRRSQSWIWLAYSYSDLLELWLRGGRKVESQRRDALRAKTHLLADRFGLRWLGERISVMG